MRRSQYRAPEARHPIAPPYKHSMAGPTAGLPIRYSSVWPSQPRGGGTACARNRDSNVGPGADTRSHDAVSSPMPVPACVALEGREGASEAAPEAVGQVVGGGAKAVRGGYCRLQMPLKPALAVRETEAGHRRGALEGGGGPPPLPMHPCPRQCLCQPRRSCLRARGRPIVHAVLVDDIQVLLPVHAGGRVEVAPFEVVCEGLP